MFESVAVCSSKLNDSFLLPSIFHLVQEDLDTFYLISLISNFVNFINHKTLPRVTPCGALNNPECMIFVTIILYLLLFVLFSI